jgi:hypothetical protein
MNYAQGDRWLLCAAVDEPDCLFHFQKVILESIPEFVLRFWTTCSKHSYGIEAVSPVDIQ